MLSYPKLTKNTQKKNERNNQVLVILKIVGSCRYNHVKF